MLKTYSQKQKEEEICTARICGHTKNKKMLYFVFYLKRLLLFNYVNFIWAEFLWGVVSVPMFDTEPNFEVLHIC